MTLESQTNTTLDQFERGHGSVPVWGYSRAFDILDSDTAVLGERITTQEDAAVQADHVNILLLNNTDPRHIITTLCNISQHPGLSNSEINFYLIEPQASLYARHLMLLSCLFNEPSHANATTKEEQPSIEQRVETFMEVYGNLLITSKTHDYIHSTSTQLIRTISGDTGPLSDHIDLSCLKFREKDDLEVVLNFYRTPENKKPFGIDKMWDARLRQYYGQRYDHIHNLVDWDYHMKVRKITPKISSPEFTAFRTKGTPFTFREQSYTLPNRTLGTANVLKEDGLKVNKWGYWSDILLAPWMAWGVWSEDKSLLQVKNGVHVKSSAEITHHNLTSLLTKYYSSPRPNWKLIVLPCDANTTLKPTSSRFKKFQRFFDKVVVGWSLAGRVGDVCEMLKPSRSDTQDVNASITPEMIVETTKYLLEIPQDAKERYITKLTEMVNSSFSSSLLTSEHANNASNQTLVLKYVTSKSEDMIHFDHVVFVKECDKHESKIVDECVWNVDWEKIGRSTEKNGNGVGKETKACKGECKEQCEHRPDESEVREKVVKTDSSVDVEHVTEGVGNVGIDAQG